MWDWLRCGYKVQNLGVEFDAERVSSSPRVIVRLQAETQKRRLMSRNGLTEEEAESRILAQMSLSDQEALADNLLWNEGSEEELGAKVEELVLDLRASPAHWKFRTFFIGLVGAVLVLLVHLLF